jgi:hypothetical protein
MTKEECEDFIGFIRGKNEERKDHEREEKYVKGKVYSWGNRR